ncbi:MAG: tetratricopeptide repeat protein [Bacteroidetes bacterium]|nr:tetratricopeptide repeat protein [Bacteroidota bacterium]
MDDEEISENELTDLIRRFESDAANNSFDYYAPHLLIALADHYIDQANYDMATDAIELAIEQHPYNAHFFSKKAFLHTVNEETREALEEINRALDLEPGNPDFLTQKGSIYELMNKPLAALEVFDEAIEHGAHEPDVLVMKMFVYFNMNNNDLAIGMIEKIFSEKIDEERIVMETHFCLQMMEAYDEGQRIFRSYLELDPFQEIVWYHLGQLCACDSKYEEAIEAFEFAMAIDDTYGEPILEKGYCLMQLDRFDEASKSFREYIKIEGPDSFSLTQLGDCHKFLEEFARARVFYRQALKIDAKFSPAWLGLAQTYAAQERFSDALPFYQKAHRHQPEDETIEYELAQTYFILEQLDDAERHLNNLVNDHPTMPEAWLLLATLQHELQDDIQAIETLLEGLDRVRDKSKLHYKLAAYYLGMGKAQEGYEHLTDALTINFEEHILLFEDAPFLERVKAVIDIIDLYRKDIE